MSCLLWGLCHDVLGPLDNCCATQYSTRHNKDVSLLAVSAAWVLTYQSCATTSPESTTETLALIAVAYPTASIAPASSAARRS